MFAVEVTDHIMIAHSLPRPVFGPAQGMHGATFTVDAAFFTSEIDEDGLAVDIGAATELLSETLKPLNYGNLDEKPEFEGKITTTEFLAHHIHTKLAEAISAGRMGSAGTRVVRLRVKLHESLVARAWYEADL